MPPKATIIKRLKLAKVTSALPSALPPALPACPRLRRPLRSRPPAPPTRHQIRSAFVIYPNALQWLRESKDIWLYLNSLYVPKSEKRIVRLRFFLSQHYRLRDRSKELCTAMEMAVFRPIATERAAAVIGVMIRTATAGGARRAGRFSLSYRTNMENNFSVYREIKMTKKPAKWMFDPVSVALRSRYYKKCTVLCKPWLRHAHCHPKMAKYILTTNNEFNQAVYAHDKFKEGRPKLVVVPQNINAVQELIMQDRHVTHIEIKASLGIKVLEEIRNSNRQRRIILHHDNASSHTSAEIIRFLRGQKIESTGHPPSSPDLSPNDFYLFPSVKNKLCGQRFRGAKRPLMCSASSAGRRLAGAGWRCPHLLRDLVNIRQRRRARGGGGALRDRNAPDLIHIYYQRRISDISDFAVDRGRPRPRRDRSAVEVAPTARPPRLLAGDAYIKAVFKAKVLSVGVDKYEWISAKIKNITALLSNSNELSGNCPRESDPVRSSPANQRFGSLFSRRVTRWSKNERPRKGLLQRPLGRSKLQLLGDREQQILFASRAPPPARPRAGCIAILPFMNVPAMRHEIARCKTVRMLQP
ncbi:Mariner Mos1 transposase [Eumeta japonica]|uniref:Mariner Mos1 transposase n=1 Tax=Eumeta variegata TaxID=151549 RepID=A0A4C1WR41_EUMVA|nr:Mariner Mos1 transposase [Eumeta japonica]